jgi:hypothetical protein
MSASWSHAYAATAAEAHSVITEPPGTEHDMKTGYALSSPPRMTPLQAGRPEPSLWLT